MRKVQLSFFLLNGQTFIHTEPFMTEVGQYGPCVQCVNTIIFIAVVVILIIIKIMRDYAYTNPQNSCKRYERLFLTQLLDPEQRCSFWYKSSSLSNHNFMLTQKAVEKSCLVNIKTLNIVKSTTLLFN